MRGSPTKSATNRLAGRVVDLVGRADLLEDTAIHHRDPVGQGERFVLVVGDQDRGVTSLALQVLQLTPGLLALGRVEMRQRLIEQQH